MKNQDFVNVGKDSFLKYVDRYGVYSEDFPIWENLRWTLGQVYLHGDDIGIPVLVAYPDLVVSSDPCVFVKLDDPMGTLELLQIAGLIHESSEIACDDCIPIGNMAGEIVWLAIDSCLSYNIPENKAIEMGLIEE